MTHCKNSKLTASLKRFAMAEGADLVGVARAESFSGAPRGHRPEDLLAGAKSVFVMAVTLPAGVLESAPSREYSISYVVANQELNRIAFETAKYLQKRGHRTVQVPASPPYDLEEMMGDLSHRHAGYLAGLGVFGKSSLLLSRRYGPRIRLVSVVTDADLEPDKVLEIDLCGECTICVMACPAKALKGRGVVDKPACDRHHVVVGRQLKLADGEQVCGVCIRVCPVGNVEEIKTPKKK